MPNTPHTRLICYCTCPSAAIAEPLAAALVEQRAAACVNIVNGIQSVYRWEGRIERDSELLLIIKTNENSIERVKSIIRELHPYQVPELVATTVVDGLTDYLNWVDSELCDE